MTALVPTICGIIDRRMLINFRVRPEVVRKLLPAPFRPKLMRGWAVAGICLIRLKDIRPRGVPALFGVNSENAAHRIAVQWDEDGRVREGVFIPRRDTNSALNRLVGGKAFPGEHRAAVFRVWESGDRFKLEMKSKDDGTFIRVQVRTTEALAAGSVFRSITEASEFFQSGSLGWSARSTGEGFEGLELSCREWHMMPLGVEFVESSFFENRELFPAGSAEFDSAFLMRDLSHEWLARGRLSIPKGNTP